MEDSSRPIIGELEDLERQTIAEDLEMMDIAEEVVGEDMVAASGMEVELGGDELIYEEDMAGIPVDDVGPTGTAEADKENTESEAGEGDFPEDAEGIVEITRRRISQDREGNCYCGKDRNLNIAEMLCVACNRWYHESCIGYQLGKLMPFMMNYVFMCKNCSPTGLESFKRSQAQFHQMCVTALANLIQASIKDGTNRTTFSKDKEIIPFFEMHWEALTTTTRRATSSWHSTLSKALQKDLDILFTMEEKFEEPGVPYFGLKINDLTSIKPSYEGMIKSGHLKLSEQGAGSGLRGRGGKRRNAMDSVTLSQGATAKKTRGDSFTPKMSSGHGYPPDHPYNKDNFRYLLAEPDPNAPFRQEFDESNDWHGKPIPPWLHRVHVPTSVLLALHDRAPQLKVSDDRLSVTGDKGYSLIRATHGISRGNWYFEAKIIDMPEGGAVRIGVGQAHANLQGPLGYDKFGYSWRSRYGTVFHQARGKSFCKGGYGLDDVVGFLVSLPEHNKEVTTVPDSCKDRPLVRFKSHLYYEDKDTVSEMAKKGEIDLSVCTGSQIMGYKNGVCQGVAFENLHTGVYYPAVSLYRNVTVRLNFGPNFWAPPPPTVQYRGFYERAEQAIIEQTVSDLIFLTENDGKLNLDNAIPTQQ